MRRSVKGSSFGWRAPSARSSARAKSSVGIGSAAYQTISGRLWSSASSPRLVVKSIEWYERLLKERDQLRQMVKEETDDELAEMARTELEELEEKLPGIEDDLRFQLVRRIQRI